MLIYDFPTHVTGFEFDYVFDWTILKYQQAQQAQQARVEAQLAVSITIPFFY